MMLLDKLKSSSKVRVRVPSPALYIEKTWIMSIENLEQYTSKKPVESFQVVKIFYLRGTCTNIENL